jgi:hypothetical protein
MFVEIIITITTTMNMSMTYYQMIHSRNQEIFVFFYQRKIFMESIILSTIGKSLSKFSTVD